MRVEASVINKLYVYNSNKYFLFFAAGLVEALWWSHLPGILLIWALPATTHTDGNDTLEPQMAKALWC